MADDLDALRARCTRAVSGHGLQTAADLLATIPADTVLDRYGAGGVVASLEGEVAGLLGKPAAVFLPSGIMAQPAALRVHADTRGRRTIAFHPQCHLDVHEGGAYSRLHGLVGRPVGDRNQLITLEDLMGVTEPLAALVLELPQRDLGGQQPAWDDLLAQVAWARERGAAAHLDGARLWESAAGYGRTPAEIAGLFDTVYVSFYKGIGALPGCCVAGPEDVVAQVREWRQRLGGTLFGLWPLAASAQSCLAKRLPRMPAYLAHARAIASAAGDVPGVTVLPDPPQTPMLHLLLQTTQDAFTASARRLAEDEGLWTWPGCYPTDVPGIQAVELSVGDATCALTAAEIADVVRQLVHS